MRWEIHFILPVKYGQRKKILYFFSLLSSFPCAYHWNGRPDSAIAPAKGKDALACVLRAESAHQLLVFR